MKKAVSVILVTLLALLVFCGCNNESSIADDMAENGTVSDGDGIIGNENDGSNDVNDNDTPTITMPTVTMPEATTPNSSNSQNESMSDTSPLDTVL